MSLSLPVPSEERLARSPLQLVVCQVRHEPIDDGAALKARARAVRAALGDAYASMTPGGAVQVTVAASQERVDVGEQRGWQLASGDGSWTAVVAGDFFALETSRYLDWNDFRSRFELLAAAVADAADVAVELRLGLRYVDRLSEPEASAPVEWATWIAPAFAGPLAVPELAPGVLALQGIAQFDGGEGLRVNLRYGCVESDPPGRWEYLLDHDCFRESGTEFSVTGTLDGMERLHTLALQIFQAAITPDYFRFLGGGAR